MRIHIAPSVSGSGWSFERCILEWIFFTLLWRVLCLEAHDARTYMIPLFTIQVYNNIISMACVVFWNFGGQQDRMVGKHHVLDHVAQMNQSI